MKIKPTHIHTHKMNRQVYIGKFSHSTPLPWRTHRARHLICQGGWWGDLDLQASSPLRGSLLLAALQVLLSHALDWLLYPLMNKRKERLLARFNSLWKETYNWIYAQNKYNIARSKFRASLFIPPFIPSYPKSALC